MEKYLFFCSSESVVHVFPASRYRGSYLSSDTSLLMFFEYESANVSGQNNTIMALTITAGQGGRALEAIAKAIETSDGPYVVIADDEESEYAYSAITAVAAPSTPDICFWSPGHFGYLTKMYIMPSDFVCDEVVERPVMVEEGESGKLVIRTHAAQDIYATVLIPNGFNATHVIVYDNNDVAVDVFSGNPANGNISSSLGSGNCNSTIDITDTLGASGTFLWIKVTTTANTDYIYGGLVTLSMKE